MAISKARLEEEKADVRGQYAAVILEREQQIRNMRARVFMLADRMARCGLVPTVDDVYAILGN